MARSSKKPRLLWVTDPWDTLDHPNDTTLRLIEESVALGVESHWCDVHSIRLETQRARLDSQKVLAVGRPRLAEAFKLAPPKAMEPKDFARILYRTDPPIDLAYLHPLQLLMVGLHGNPGTELVNAPEALFFGNEKAEGALLGSLMPPSLISSQKDVLEAFGRKEGKAVLKPLHQAQSKGVELLDWSTDSGRSHARLQLEMATERFTHPVLLQRYLPEILGGEQRLWFLNGKLLAVARKVPKSGEFKINMDQGGTLALTRLTAKEKKAADKIGKLLREKKIRLAAVDLIGGYVTDSNFTSPGLLAPMEKLLGENLARPVIQSLIRPWK